MRQSGHPRHECTAVRGSVRGSAIRPSPMWTAGDRRRGHGDHNAACSTATSSSSLSRTGLPACCSSAQPSRRPRCTAPAAGPPPPGAARRARRPSRAASRPRPRRCRRLVRSVSGDLGGAAQPGRARLALAQRPHVRLDHRCEQRGAQGREVGGQGECLSPAPTPPHGTTVSEDGAPWEAWSGCRQALRRAVLGPGPRLRLGPPR
jgi:hypothetical protein